MKAKTVLIVDDDRTLVGAMTIRCNYLGLAVHAAFDAMHALRLIHDQPPDLIIMDVHMPAGNGLAACELLATNERFAAIPTIILSAKSDHHTIERCKQLNAHYVNKNTGFWDELKPLICKHLDIHATPVKRSKAAKKNQCAK